MQLEMRSRLRRLRAEMGDILKRFLQVRLTGAVIIHLDLAAWHQHDDAAMGRFCCRRLSP